MMSSSVAASEMLQERERSFLWPCITHCMEHRGERMEKGEEGGGGREEGEGDDGMKGRGGEEGGERGAGRMSTCSGHWHAASPVGRRSNGTHTPRREGV